MGLLPMAGTFLVGTAVGFSIALSTPYWIKASDGLANLWGGIIGAGLGSAIAIFGAVHVQRTERKDQLTASVNQTLAAAEELSRKLRLVLHYLSPQSATSFGNPDELIEAQLGVVRQAQMLLDALPNAFDIPPAIHSQLRAYKVDLGMLLASFVDCAEHIDEAFDLDRMARDIGRKLAELESLKRLLAAI